MTRKPRVRYAVQCQECGKNFTVGAKLYDVDCPKCGSMDIDLQRKEVAYA